MKIMLVEDEALIALSMKIQLTRAGYMVSQLAASGEAALAGIARERPDIVVIDKGLPGKIDGLEAAQRIHAEYGIPLIFVTGFVDKRFMEEAHKLNPLAILIKPVPIEDLLAVLKKAIP
jgi:DNA-binding response OmpR family regulator